MRVKVWGCRGSIAVPGPTTLRYGGNTTCLEVRNDKGGLLIIDAGTGIRELGMSLLSELPLTTPIFFTHTHYDHVIGYPFFLPFFMKTNTFDLYGPIHYERSFCSVMTEQLDYSFFPVRMDEFCANLQFHDLKEEVIETEGFHIETMYVNHPITTLAYRISADEKVFLFTGDTEPYSNYLENESDVSKEEFDEVEEVVQEQNNRWIQFLKGTDLCLYDTQYTPEEYPKFKGWGHTPMDVAIENCEQMGVKKLLMTHHAPTRTDDELDQLSERWKKYTEERGYKIETAFAVEKQEYQL